jgi:hypothetical protein
VDDISLEDEISEPDPEPESEPLIEPEEEVLDIDDSTASGRLSVLRRELETDSSVTLDTKEDLSSRMDSFLADR